MTPRSKPVLGEGLPYLTSTIANIKDTDYINNLTPLASKHMCKQQQYRQLQPTVTQMGMAGTMVLLTLKRTHRFPSQWSHWPTLFYFSSHINCATHLHQNIPEKNVGVTVHGYMHFLNRTVNKYFYLILISITMDGNTHTQMSKTMFRTILVLL